MQLNFGFHELPVVYVVIANLTCSAMLPGVCDDSPDVGPSVSRHPGIDVARCPCAGVRIELGVALTLQQTARQAVGFKLCEEGSGMLVSGLVGLAYHLGGSKPCEQHLAVLWPLFLGQPLHAAEDNAYQRLLLGKFKELNPVVGANRCVQLVGNAE